MIIEGVDSLSEREKEALRLLLVGHDAKSIAVHLDLSIHTVNERLRDARRKLGVTSSKEAARMLAAFERGGTDSLGDKDFGVSPADISAPVRSADRHPSTHRLAWFAGGMLIMSLIIAAAILASVTHGGEASTQEAPSTMATTPIAHPAGLRSAQDWAALLDNRRWDESWNTASGIFQTGIPKDGWITRISSLRDRLGKVSARSFRSASEATALPGAPAGRYEIIQFDTNFAQKPGAIETVVVSLQGDDWKVAGYFIR